MEVGEDFIKDTIFKLSLIEYVGVCHAEKRQRKQQV